MAGPRIDDSAFVYIMSNRSHRLYTGATVNLPKRVGQHKEGTYPNAFTARYKFYRLVYYEPQRSYVRREHQIKGWTRAKRVALIQSANPRWKDLSLQFDDLVLAR